MSNTLLSILIIRYLKLCGFSLAFVAYLRLIPFKSLTLLELLSSMGTDTDCFGRNVPFQGRKTLLLFVSSPKNFIASAAASFGDLLSLMK